MRAMWKRISPGKSKWIHAVRLQILKKEVRWALIMNLVCVESDLKYLFQILGLIAVLIS